MWFKSLGVWPVKQMTSFKPRPNPQHMSRIWLRTCWIYDRIDFWGSVSSMFQSSGEFCWKCGLILQSVPKPYLASELSMEEWGDLWRVAYSRIPPSSVTFRCILGPYEFHHLCEPEGDILIIFQRNRSPHYRPLTDSKVLFCSCSVLVLTAAHCARK